MSPDASDWRQDEPPIVRYVLSLIDGSYAYSDT